MSDESPNVTSESSEPRPPKVGRWWWIPVTFIVPFAVIYEYLGAAAHSNISACCRSGAIGVGVAALVYGVWLIDQKIQNRPTKPVGPLIGMLGMMLWLGWVVAAHVMVIAYDDAKYLAESETH